MKQFVKYLAITLVTACSPLHSETLQIVNNSPWPIVVFIGEWKEMPESSQLHQYVEIPGTLTPPQGNPDTGQTVEYTPGETSFVVVCKATKALDDMNPQGNRYLVYGSKIFFTTLNSNPLAKFTYSVSPSSSVTFDGYEGDAHLTVYLSENDQNVLSEQSRERFGYPLLIDSGVRTISLQHEAPFSSLLNPPGLSPLIFRR